MIPKFCVRVTYKMGFSLSPPLYAPTCNTRSASCSSDLLELLFFFWESISHIASRLSDTTTTTALRSFQRALHPQSDGIVFQRWSVCFFFFEMISFWILCTSFPYCSLWYNPTESSGPLRKGNWESKLERMCLRVSGKVYKSWSFGP